MTVDEETEAVIQGIDMVRDIEDFHKKFKIDYSGMPRALPTELKGFRQNFMNEELQEYVNASRNLDAAIKASDDADITYFLAQQLDALVDLVYVAMGTAHMQGFDFATAWYRVHKANMAKVRAEREEDSKRGSVYDVVKPRGWVAPNHDDLVEEHAHRQGVLEL